MVEFRFNPDELLSEEIIIDKLEAACRQMESAIAMFFHDGDVVSQHTLIMAAHGILYDLARQRGIGGSIKDSPLVAREVRREFIKAVHLPQNFFKHADEDGDGKLRFRYNGSHFWLFDAVRLFVLLGGQITHAMKVFPDVVSVALSRSPLLSARRREPPDGPQRHHRSRGVQTSCAHVVVLTLGDHDSLTSH